MKRLEALEQRANPKARRLTYAEHLAFWNSPEGRVLARAADAKREARQAQRKAAWERMTLDSRIRHKRRELTKLVAEGEARARDSGPKFGYNDAWYGLQCRLLELEIIELEGGSPEVVSVARDQANNSFCRKEPLPPIPTHEEAVAIIQASRPAVAPVARLPESDDPLGGLQYWRAEKLRLTSHHRTRDAEADHRRQDKLADYRHSGREPTEPDVT